MRFFEQHFNRHHFFHAPHLWFFALLASPIHFAELRYQKKYRLKFEHAKKLFVFDLILLLTIMALIGSGAFWFTYNPGVANLVYLSIKPSAPKTMSGEYITYNLFYKNASAVTLTGVQLKLNFPVGFILDKTAPETNSADFIFTLPNLAPQAQNSLAVSGWIYGTPNKEENITATLSYFQEKRQRVEEKNTLLIKILRGSVLESQISAPSFISANQTVTLTLILKNNSEKPLTKIRLPLLQATALFPTAATVNLGLVENNVWQIEYLEPKTSAEIKITLGNNAAGRPQKLTAVFIPSLNINKTDLPQSAIEHTFKVAYPRVALTLNWQNQKDALAPGEVAVLQISAKNTGNINLENTTLSLPLPAALVDNNRLAKLNLGQIQNQIWKITGEQLAGLKNFPTAEELNYNLQIPLAFLPQGGTDLTFTPTLTLLAEPTGTTDSIFNAEAIAPTLKIGTQVSLQPEARYFTKEGDQLGRGPLPPQVGKETKYWILIPIINSTSKIKDLKLNAVLPDYLSWTCKTSVSHGNKPEFSDNAKKISWTLNSLPAHTQAGVYFEVAWIPTAEQIGATPLLLKNIIFSAVDSYIGAAINKTSPDLDSSLPNDTQAQNKGVIVAE